MPALSLRTALWIDAIASVVTGLIGLLLAGPLSDWTDLPVGIFRGAGAALIPFVAYLIVLATRDVIGSAGVKLAIIINIIWATGSVAILFGSRVDPNAFGYAFVIAQAAAVALFAELQATALGRERTRNDALPASA
ncbi:MAG TPA: hypothetical protein VD767_01360 [Thermomicrobiales bacterium]|nr:hypothetical protein [Thermomicrobiales bacterium]